MTVKTIAAVVAAFVTVLAAAVAAIGADHRVLAAAVAAIRADTAFGAEHPVLAASGAAIGAYNAFVAHHSALTAAVAAATAHNTVIFDAAAIVVVGSVFAFVFGLVYAFVFVVVAVYRMFGVDAAVAFVFFLACLVAIAVHKADFADVFVVVAGVSGLVSFTRFWFAPFADDTRAVADAVAADAAPAPPPDPATPNPNEDDQLNLALRRKVYLGWWDRNFRPNRYDSNAVRQEKSELEKERRSIQLGLELRYSLLELAARRLTESLRRTGLRANAREDPYSLTARVHGSKDKIGLTSTDFDGEFSFTGKLRDAGNMPGAARQIGDPEFLPSLSTWQLATIDVFVEKAQYFLTTRIKQNEGLARLSTCATLAVMLSAICFGYFMFDNRENPARFLSPLFYFLGNATLLGLLLGIAYFFSSLTRAFLHEATILKNRRHAVRLGRMVLHLKVSSARSPEHRAEIIADLNLNDLEQAFGWNLETSTAFKDINPEAMTTSLTGQLLQKVSEAFASVKRPG